MTADQIRSLQPALAALLEHFRPFFKRERTFKHWERYLLGLMADLKRKSIEPIALAAGVAVRTLQEFLAFFVWDHQRVAGKLQQFLNELTGKLFGARLQPLEKEIGPGAVRERISKLVERIAGGLRTKVLISGG